MPAKTRRSRMELVFDILEAIQNRGGQIKPTHLMYKSNLSHKLLTNYLQELTQKEMVEVREYQQKKTVNKMVHITEKGLGFVEEYRKMREFTSAFGL
ncbi:hypothetical protein HOC01_05120 [archaeon]|jgi:predicted transcriptional regulator|nr:hypothetical protein [archaeon]MBT6698191.1 hypothetical protein [archaeon]